MRTGAPAQPLGATAARLVLLPGLDGIGKRFVRFVAALGTTAEVAIIRYPVDRALGYAELEAHVRAALPCGARFVLLGESFSGPLAIRIAADPPPGLAAVVLCSSFARFPLRVPGWAVPIVARAPVKTLPRWLRALLQWGSLDPRRAPPAHERSMAAVSREVIRHRIAELLRIDARARLGDVRMPVLVMSGRRDWLLAGGSARALARAVPHGRWVEIEGPHALLQSRPEACAEAVLQFMRQWI